VEKPIDTIHLLEDIVVGSILIVSINGLLFGLDLNDNGAIIVDTLTRPYLFFLSSRSPVNGDPIHAIVENKYGVVDPNESYLYFISPYGSIGTFDRWTHIVHTGSHESISPPPPMKAPTGLSASLVTATTLYLEWDRNTVEPDAYYEIWQLGNPIRIGIELHPDANPGWNVLHGLSPNTEYTFSVVSRDRNGIRPDSTSVSMTVATIGVRLEPPQDIEITNATENSITLQWTTVELSRFIIIQDGVTLATVDSMPLGRSTYILTGLTPDTRYTLTVKAVDLAGIKLDSYPNAPYPRDKKTLPLP
jgi:hypothetical protein